MKENTCNYSDNWQPYIGDYDKYEYDIKCHDGTIYENCYPNAGKFSPIDNQKLSIGESKVSEIRFSNNPKMMLNEDVSQYKTSFEELEAPSADKVFMVSNPYTEFDSITYPNLHHRRTTQYKREFPKISRNAPCVCQSGKKYKNCCLS